MQHSPNQLANEPARDPPPFPHVVLGQCHRKDSDVSVFNPATGRVELASDVLVADTGTGTAVGAGSAADQVGDRAYWLRHTLREATYGRVRYALALRRRPRGVVAAADGGADAEWEATDEKCAVKEMSWKQIRGWKDRLAEDPMKEVAAMHYLKEYCGRRKCAGGVGRSVVDEMLHTHTIMPLDILSDDQCLYSIMPYCNGELFDVLGERDNFSEVECRCYMHQVLTGLEHLHGAGICHRDLRPENLLLHHDSKCLVIIDLGKCLRIPHNKEKRYLISPQGTCGMLHYEPPEIASDSPFDGHSIDVFAVGVILFLMLTGFPPWERPHQSDERFKYMSAGYLAQMLTEWGIDLSHEAMDLLQGMLWLDPKDRLSLQQVRDHAWMKLSD